MRSFFTGKAGARMERPASLSAQGERSVLRKCSIQHSARRSAIFVRNGWPRPTTWLGKEAEMSRFRRRSHEMPGLNTASLPDLIFSVLFFFMIVTHMRKVTIKVKYRVPHATELTRLTKKTAISYVYIGKPERLL